MINVIPVKSLEFREFQWFLRDNDPLPIDAQGQLFHSRNPVGWLAADGTFVANGDSFRDPTLYPPPSEEIALWKKRRDYAEADVKQTRSDFENLKATALGGPTAEGWTLRWRFSYGPDPGEIEAQLMLLVNAIRTKQAALETLESKAPEPIAQDRQRKADREREQAELEARRREEAEARRARIFSINP